MKPLIFLIASLALMQGCSHEEPSAPAPDAALQAATQPPDEPDEPNKAKPKKLIEAVLAGHAETVQALLAAGADSNAEDSNGRTALSYAAASKNTESVKALIAAGADVRVRAKQRYQLTPLPEPLPHGAPKAAKLLIEAGADVNAKTKLPDGSWSVINHRKIFGKTALSFAAAPENVALVRMLLDAGAKEKDAALLLGAGNAEIVQMRLKAGANVNAKVWEGNALPQPKADIRKPQSF